MQNISLSITRQERLLGCGGSGGIRKERSDGIARSARALLFRYPDTVTTKRSRKKQSDRKSEVQNISLSITRQERLLGCGGSGGIRKERSDGIARSARALLFRYPDTVTTKRSRKKQSDRKSEVQNISLSITRQERLLGCGGSGGIRTLEPIARLLDFESSPL